MAVYFMRDGGTGAIKIGRSEKPRARLAQVQVHSASPVQLLAIEEGGKEVEASRHAQFAHLRIRGEWFQPAGELMAHISNLGALEETGSRAFWNGKSDAEIAAETGLCRAMIKHVRTGRRRPSPENAITIQRATGVSAIALVFGDLASEAA